MAAKKAVAKKTTKPSTVKTITWDGPISYKYLTGEETTGYLLHHDNGIDCFDSGVVFPTIEDAEAYCRSLEYVAPFMISRIEVVNKYI